MINVLIVDDHDLVRFGLSRIVSDTKGMHVVGEASSGEEAIKFVRETLPDVVLMDVRMPGSGGIEATRKILQITPETKIIAVTACDDTPFANRLLQAGASGYLSKGASPDEIILAIQKVNCGQKYISPDIAQRMALQPFALGDKNPFDSLSERELQIALMIVGCQKVIDIGEKLFLSTKTVNGYRYRIFEKLGISGDVELTHLAVHHGLIEPLSYN